jgi:hypothetical protein
MDEKRQHLVMLDPTVTENQNPPLSNKDTNQNLVTSKEDIKSTVSKEESKEEEEEEEE